LQTIAQTENNALIQIKGNQKFLLKACTEVTKNTTPSSIHTDRTHGRGRKEKRTAQVFRNLSTFNASIKKQWGAYVKAVVTISRTVTFLNTKTKRHEKRSETAYYVSTETIVSAKQANRFIRAHWGIENRNHYVRDVTMQEDLSRIRRNPDRMVRLRSFALNVLRANDVECVSLARFENGLCIENMLQYKGI
jgi:predicted transposase YbfD/YdcC